jgi:hypothetical protein
MLPGTAAFTFAGGALSDGRGDVKRTLVYLAIAGVLLVLISLIPRWLQRRSRLAGELLKTGIVTALLASALPAHAAAAVLDRYPTTSIKDGGSLLSPIWKKKIGVLGGAAYSLDDIEHGILRKAFKEPRVHFAIVCASLSCPDLRPEPFEAARLSLTDAGLSYLGYDWSLNDTARVSS